MDLWQEIVKTAVIGVERQPLAVKLSTGALGHLLARFDQTDREGTLLGAAGAAALYERAGRLPMRDPSPFPEPCAEDDLPRCSKLSAQHLNAMLTSHYANLLPEWLATIAAKGMRAPEDLLPMLLERGRTQAQLREEIISALGDRGRWLAAQSPDWDYVVGRADEDVWETGSPEQRLTFLARLRKGDTAKARELLSSTWRQETPKERADFIAALSDGLTLADEVFLESALDDRRKEVRKAAADLLARMSQSKLCQRMIERASALFEFKRRKFGRDSIEVALPEVCDKAMQRDGIEPKPPYSGIGEKAWWLQQVLCAIPPSFWEKESSWTIEELIRAAERSEWKEILFMGWTQAARRYFDAEWIEALLDMNVHREQIAWQFQALPPERQQCLILHWLAKDSSIYPTTITGTCLAVCRWQWDDELSRVVIDSLYQQARTDSFGVDWIWQGLLAMIGCQLHLAIIPDAIIRLTEAMSTMTERSSALGGFLSFIQLRHEMLEEINQ